MASYHPIENYGLIGDMHTAALVSIDGSIDWFCAPRFDSPSIFASLLDGGKGGSFSIRPERDGVEHKQAYWPETNALVTRFLEEKGALELTDFMPVGEARGPGSRIVRRVRCQRGTAQAVMRCRPAFNYARDDTRIETIDGGFRCTGGRQGFTLISDAEITEEDGVLTAHLDLEEGQERLFILTDESGREPEHDPRAALGSAHELFQRTVDYWLDWIGKCTYQGRWREMVHRSALALKLMTYEPSGAVIASPTCGLPEQIGGERNWDYRYTWIRDGAFTLYALLRLGFSDEAAAYMGFLGRLCTEGGANGPLQVMYGVEGEKELAEHALDHLEGYRGSRPVRIGNAAYDQLQLDIYGALMDAAYLYNKWGEPVSLDLWRSLHGFVDWVCDNWQRKDEGIWETRGGRKHFTYSKLMCWVAVDRGIRLAEKRSFPADRDRWVTCRDAIFNWLIEKGWNEHVGAFVQHEGCDTLDAATLIMPLVFFMSPTDPRMLSTIEAIDRSPRDGGLVADGLVFRYDPSKSPDGLDGAEGTFNMCTFWLVEALTRAGQFHPERLREARLDFERMLGFSNHLGLFSEEIGLNGRALGNFPQAFTHLSLISAAFNLDRALGEGG